MGTLRRIALCPLGKPKIEPAVHYYLSRIVRHVFFIFTLLLAISPSSHERDSQERSSGATPSSSPSSYGHGRRIQE